MRLARGVFRSFASVDKGAGSCALAPGPRAPPPASRWGSRRQPRPAPRPRPLRPGRGRREGAGPAVPPPPCSVPCLRRSAPGGPTRGPLHAAPPAPGGHARAGEGAPLLGHHLAPPDRPALPPARPLARPGPRATPPEGKWGELHPSDSSPSPSPVLPTPSKFPGARGDGWGEEEGAAGPRPTSPSPGLTFPAAAPSPPRSPRAPRPPPRADNWSAAPLRARRCLPVAEGH